MSGHIPVQNADRGKKKGERKSLLTGNPTWMTQTTAYRLDSPHPPHEIPQNCIRLELYSFEQPLLYIWQYAGDSFLLHSTAALIQIAPAKSHVPGFNLNLTLETTLCVK